MTCCVALEPVPWAEAFGTSWLFSPQGLLIFRAILFLIYAASLLTHMHHHLVIENQGFFYLIYLTRWVLLIQLLYFILLIYTTRLAQRSPDVSQPWCISCTVALFTAVQPLSLGITAAFWLGTCGMSQLMEQSMGLSNALECPSPGYLKLFAHGINWILIFLSFVFGRIPYYVKNTGLLWTIALAYLAWSVAHYHLLIGTPEPCLTYKQNECPIYPKVIDWHPEQRRRTAAIILLIFVVSAPITTGIYRAIGLLRDTCDKKRNPYQCCGCCCRTV